MKRIIVSFTAMCVMLAICACAVASYPGQDELNVVSAYLKGDASVSRDEAVAALDVLRRLISPESDAGYYVINKNSGTFHEPGCSHIASMKPENKLTMYQTYAELVEHGYHPCGTCLP